MKVMLKRNAEKFTKLNYSADNGQKCVLFRLSDKKEAIQETGYIIRSGGLPQIMQPVVPVSLQQPLEMPDAETVEFPDIVTEKFLDVKAENDEDARLIDLRYPLIPRDPKGGKVFAYAHIFYDQKINQLAYNLIEPLLDDRLKHLIESIKAYVQEKIDINFSQVKNKNAESYIVKLIDSALIHLGHGKKDSYDTVRYYILRDFIGLEAIEPFMHDQNIEDVSCDGVGIPIFVYHRDPRIGSVKTNIAFSDRDHLDAFAIKLAERCGKSLSVAKPLLDSTLPDGSRIQATLGSDIARQGSNFTIRMFTENPLTPVDMLSYSTCDLKMMSYFWFLVERGASVLISGGTASGKTSFLNVLSLFIKPQMKIISIEDTAELRLPHSHWVPEVARTPISEEGKVDMYELLRESLRQRPDYIIVGEVRGREAFVLFQQMSIGHPGMATIHAENMQKLMDRLTTAPISLSPNLIQNLDLLIFLKSVKTGRKYIRRVVSVVEVLGFDKRTRLPIVTEIFKWEPKSDAFTAIKDSVLLKKTADKNGLSVNDVKEDLENRSKILEWMLNHDIKNFRRVASVINMFYTSPEFLIRRVEEDI